MKKALKIIFTIVFSLTILVVVAFGVERWAGLSIVTKAVNTALPEFANGKATIQSYKIASDLQTLNGVSYKDGAFELNCKTLITETPLSKLLFSDRTNYTLSDCKIIYRDKEIASFDTIQMDCKKNKIVLYGVSNVEGKDSTIKIVAHMDQSPLIEIALQNVPTKGLNHVSEIASIEDVVGSHMSILTSIHPGKAQTTASIQLHSPNLSFKTSGIIKDGNFLLKEPLTGSFFLRESLSQKFFDSGESTLTSIDPIWVYIDPENTSIPIINPSWEGVMIPKISIDFGSLQCNRFYALNTLLSIMNLEVNLSPSIPTKIEETHLSIEHGICKFDKTHFVVNNQYPLVSWGSYNLKTNELDVQLGVAKPFLEKSLGYKNLPTDFTISLRVTGDIKKPVYHIENTVVDIAELAIRQKLPIEKVLIF